MEGIERLEKEINEATDDFSKIIGKKALEEMAKDNVLEECYTTKNRSLKEMIEFINKSAREYLHGTNGGIEDAVVYGWAIHYIQDAEVTPKNVKEKQKETKTPTVKPVVMKKEKAVEGQMSLWDLLENN